ncbi:MAG: DNA polymerase III subunit beta [Bacilli bacterium]|jgi:DNA polymerase-3 subunit beta|nr:DNA polymerase III subunit beta [Bacilli bacterium]
MKFKIKKNELANAIRKVSHVINAKSPVLALNGIYFDVSDNKLSLIGSDTEITIKTTINDNIEVLEDGKIILPKFIESTIAKINDEFIDFELINNELLLLKAGKLEYKINGVDANQFPTIDFNHKGELLKFSKSDIIDIINETCFAVSNEVIRPQLTGVNMICENNLLTCTATDSFRLAKKSFHINENLNFNIIVPGKCLNEVNKLVSYQNEDNNVDVYIEEQRLLFEIDSTVVISRLIKGSYPQTSNLIPNNFESTLVIDKKVIKDALDRSNVLSINTQNFTVNLEKNDNVLTLSSKNKEVGDFNEELDYLSYIGNNIKISFNSKYVTDALNAFKNDNIKFQFNGNMNPIIIVNEDDDSLIQLILPVKNPF